MAKISKKKPLGRGLSSLLGDSIPLPQLRKQDEKNRQNSTDDLDPMLIQELEVKMMNYFM